MLKSISIKDFKCHQDYNTFKFPGLTFLSGANNSGKSSIIQSILLLAKSNTNNSEPTLLLNTNLYQLGTFKDVLNNNKSREDSIEFSLKFKDDYFKTIELDLKYKDFTFGKNINNKGIAVLEELEIFSLDKNGKKQRIKAVLDETISENEYKIFFNENERQDLSIHIFGCSISPSLSKLKQKENFNIDKEFFEYLLHLGTVLNLFDTDNIKYLRAYREEAKKLYEMKGLNHIGISGEATAEVLYRNKSTKIEFGDKKNFQKLFEEWCYKILGDTYRVYSDENGSFYQLKVEENNTNIYDITQVGFGFSQVIPIITMILLSEENDVLLIENPEVHLHPKLQANLAELFVFAAKHNRKIIVETHSEHIINRTRLLIKESASSEKVNEKVNIYFFEKYFDEDESYIKSDEILIDENGKISSWPENFFDQGYKDSIGLIKND